MVLLFCASMLHADPVAPELDQGFLPPPPPEYTLIIAQPQGPSLVVSRVASMIGTAGGIALMVWGLGNMADAFGRGAESGEIHAGLSLTISGSVLAALSSTIYSLLQGNP